MNRFLGFAALTGFALAGVDVAATQGGNPAIEAEQYVLKNHGRLIRELSFAEYEALKANEFRGFSGHWLFFYFVPLAYFMFGKSQCDSP